MAATAMTLWLIALTVLPIEGQKLWKWTPEERICQTISINRLPSMSKLDRCTVIVGNLKINLEYMTSSNFKNLSFPALREVTGMFIMYRVTGLESVGQLFPNLARVRGNGLVEDYAFAVHDMENLREIGLSNLLKVDRGGVAVWGGPHTCFVTTVDWNAIAPNSRHVVNQENGQCAYKCTCSLNHSRNYCWNNMKCQRFLEGPEAMKCDDQCLGCRNTGVKDCMLCRHKTYLGNCVAECPKNTILLTDNQYCITEDQCTFDLDGIIFNNTCIFECPVDYIEMRNEKGMACIPCINCQKTCTNIKIRTISHIQAADRCVYVNGSLTINIRAVPEALEELRKYLSRIEEVTDYILIYGSLTISSLDFLSSLKVIRGRNLANNQYSLVIHDMDNLQSLFSENVTKHLKIERGKLSMYSVPVLCKTKIDEIRNKFPVKSTKTDIADTNGYASVCDEKPERLTVESVSETEATLKFSSSKNQDAQYTVLYVRLPSGSHSAVVPETCTESDWRVIKAPSSDVIELKSLRPASTYVVCTESYIYSNGTPLQLARSKTVNFTTLLGKPAPPFITELTGSSSESAVLRWVDHKDFYEHITRYELDVSLIEIHTKDIVARDHCNIQNLMNSSPEDVEYSRHAVVYTPPPEYHKGCESMCGVLSTLAAGSMAEEEFDICSSLDSDCDNYEEPAPTNTSFGKYVRTMVLDINSHIGNSSFQVGGLAPYRDYRFRLRACIKNVCSRSTRATVRTLKSSKADVPTLIYELASENGEVYVKWKPPDITNGPILAFSVHVLPVIDTDITYLIPQVWCTSVPNESSMTVKSEVANKYLVKICSTTLGSFDTCSDWKKVITIKSDYSFIWIGLLFSIIAMIISVLLGFFIKRRVDDGDLIPLVTLTSMNRIESDPVGILFLTDFSPFYSVPLTERI